MTACGSSNVINWPATGATVCVYLFIGFKSDQIANFVVFFTTVKFIFRYDVDLKLRVIASFFVVRTAISFHGRTPSGFEDPARFLWPLKMYQRGRYRYASRRIVIGFEKWPQFWRAIYSEKTIIIRKLIIISLPIVGKFRKIWTKIPSLMVRCDTKILELLTEFLLRRNNGVFGW